MNETGRARLTSRTAVLALATAFGATFVLTAPGAMAQAPEGLDAEVPVLAGSQSRVDTLVEALSEAYLANPTLLGERAALRATDEQVEQAVSGWRPTVSANAAYGIQEQRSGSNIQFGGQSFTLQSEPFSWGASVSQPVFRGFRTLNEFRQAKATVRAGRAQLDAVEQQVLLDTVSAYMNIVRDVAVVELSENNVTVLNRQREAARDRFEVGEVTRTDVAQAEARLSRARSNLIEAQAAVTTSVANFERIVGATPDLPLEPPPPLPELPETEEEALALAVEFNPRIRAARESAEARDRAVAVAKGALLPTLSIQGNVRHSEDSLNRGSQSFSKDVQAQVSVPLYQAGRTYSQIRQAKHLENEARIRIVEARREVEELTASAWERFRAANAVIVAAREEVAAAEVAFEGVQQEAQVGARTTLDVLDAEQELLNARVSLVRAERDAYVAGFQVLSAIGYLSADNLALPVPIYDPVEAYEDSGLPLLGIGWGTGDD